MHRRLRFLLFCLTSLIAALLFLLVLLTPLADNGSERPNTQSRWLAVFARDTALRRTAVASALGLLVTGWVFFRPPRRWRPRVRRTPGPPPPDIAGA
jgi:hypothetical protein